MKSLFSLCFRHSTSTHPLPIIAPSIFVYRLHCSQARRYTHDNAMGKKEKTSFQLKTPKGTKDWVGSDMAIRDQIFSTVSNVFKKHGAVSLDTPVFELKDILSGKYGEDSKLIYDLQDQGGELCSLRYDLTVPLARFLAMNPQIQNIKRYQIAKVYRRDQPAMTKGRMREFYQCDFDIAGTYDAMIPDAEILRIASEAFNELGFKGKYTIKINHRKILDGIFATAGVPAEKIRTISSAVDKLDKSPWEEVKREMTEEKGLDAAVADRIGEYVKHKGGRDVLELLKADAKLNENESAKAGIADMELLFDYLEIFGVLDRLSFDMSLARGLDYYTGVIYELVTDVSAPAAQKGSDAAKELQKKAKKDKSLDDDDRSNDPTIGVGSLAAGGRYDELVGMFNPRGKIPCVGISLGVDRIFSVIKSRLALEAEQQRSSEVDVFVMAFGGKGLLPERMAVAKELWDAGVKTEFSWKKNPKLPAQFKAAEAAGIPFAIILGEDELKNGQVKIKEMGLPADHPEKEGVPVNRSDLPQEIKRRITSRGESTLVERLAAVKVDDIKDAAAATS